MAARTPVFLARARYRQRRLRDALRLLPIVGGVLWLVPLLWPRGAEGPGNATALLYVFAVWVILIVAGAVLAARLDPEADQGPDAGRDVAPAQEDR